MIAEWQRVMNAVQMVAREQDRLVNRFVGASPEDVAQEVSLIASEIIECISEMQDRHLTALGDLRSKVTLFRGVSGVLGLIAVIAVISTFVQRFQRCESSGSAYQQDFSTGQMQQTTERLL